VKRELDRGGRAGGVEFHTAVLQGDFLCIARNSRNARRSQRFWQPVLRFAESNLGGLIVFLSSNFNGRFKALHGDCQKLGVRGHSCHLLPILEALQLPRSESRVLKICDHFDLFALFLESCLCLCQGWSAKFTSSEFAEASPQRLFLGPDLERPRDTVGTS
jgi:hypothetical protein